MGRVHYGAQIIRTAFRAGRLETRDFKEIIRAQSAEPECGYPPLSPGSWSQLRACSAKGKPNDCRGAAAPHTASRFHPSLTVSLGGVLASFTSCRRASSASELGVSCITRRHHAIVSKEDYSKPNRIEFASAGLHYCRWSSANCLGRGENETYPRNWLARPCADRGGR
jgi:hypothetical protein